MLVTFVSVLYRCQLVLIHRAPAPNDEHPNQTEPNQTKPETQQPICVEASLPFVRFLVRLFVRLFVCRAGLPAYTQPPTVSQSVSRTSKSQPRQNHFKTESRLVRH